MAKVISMGCVAMVKCVVLFVLVQLAWLTAASAEGFEDFHQCDEYAAHPNDPNRWAQGVADDLIVPGPAIKYCRDAVAEHPDTPRFMFQLGRALWAARKDEEGLQIFLELEEAFEYGPVYAYLGDAYLYGIGGAEVDEELAVTLYQIADEGGFQPASEVLAALSADLTVEQQVASVVPAEAAPLPGQPQQSSTNNQPFVPQEVIDPERTTRKFNESAYLEPKIMSGFYHGNLDNVRQGDAGMMAIDKVYFYLDGFLGPFAQNYNFRDPNCVYLHNPQLNKAIAIKIAQSTPGGGMLMGNGRSLEDNLDAGAAQGWKLLGQMLTGVTEGTGIMGTDFGQDAIDIGFLKTNGEKDATRLIDQHGCASDVTRQVFSNIVFFVTGNGKVTISAEETKRREVEKQEEAKKREEQRQEGLRATAQNSCVSQFQKHEYCNCLIQGLDEQTITDTEWQMLGSNFKDIVSLLKSYPALSGRAKSCGSKG